MTIDTELVAIGIALLGIILGTWTYLHNINKKLNKLILLVGKSDKKEEDSHNTDSTQTNHQHSFACAIRSYIKKCIHNLRGKITFYRKEKYQFNNYQQVNYTTKQLRLDRTYFWLSTGLINDPVYVIISL